MLDDPDILVPDIEPDEKDSDESENEDLIPEGFDPDEGKD